MRVRAISAAMVVVAAASGLLTPLSAQTLTNAQNTSQTVPSPTEPIYNAAPTGNVTGANTTPNFSVTATCATTGKPGCELDIILGTAPSGGALNVQWKLVSAVPTSTGDCGNAAVTGTFVSVPSSLTTVATLASNHGAQCTFTFQFQVATLSYSTHPAPGPGGAAVPYVQGVVFSVK